MVTTDGIVIDDMSFAEWAAEEVIQLASIKQRRTIHCRYKDAVLPQFMPIICTTNLNPDDWLPRCGFTRAQRHAILDRIQCMEVTGPLYRAWRQV